MQIGSHFPYLSSQFCFLPIMLILRSVCLCRIILMVNFAIKICSCAVTRKNRYSIPRQRHVLTTGFHHNGHITHHAEQQHLKPSRRQVANGFIQNYIKKMRDAGSSKTPPSAMNRKFPTMAKAELGGDQADIVIFDADSKFVRLDATEVHNSTGVVVSTNRHKKNADHERFHRSPPSESSQDIHTSFNGNEGTVAINAENRQPHPQYQVKPALQGRWKPLVDINSPLEIFHPVEAFNQRRYDLMKAENDLLDQILWSERVKARRAMQLG